MNLFLSFYYDVLYNTFYEAFVIKPFQILSPFLTLLCMGGGGGVDLTPFRVFLITFFSLTLRAWNFLTLRFYPLDTMWRNFTKKY